MRILQLTNRLPWPLKDGGAIGLYQFTKGYAKAGCELTLLSMNTSKHYVNPEELPSFFREKIKLFTVFVDNKVEIKSAVKNLFKNKSYHIERFISAEYENKLTEILQSNQFDIVHFDGLYVSMYLPAVRKFSNAKCVFRAHNVEHLIWKRITSNTGNFIKKKYIERLTKQLKSYEEKQLNQFDLILPVSKADEHLFRVSGCIKPFHRTPAGINIEAYSLKNEAIEPQSVFHIGAMDWFPNIEAVKYLVNEIWQKVRLKMPEAKLYLAGRRMPAEFNQFESESIHVEGEVSDAQQFMQSKSVMTIPLLSGSGMRIKIIEGMALGKAIVSTTIGAEGIDCTNDKDILLADSPAEFANQIVRCLQNPDLVSRLGQNARHLAEEEYDNTKIIFHLLEAYKKPG